MTVLIVVNIPVHNLDIAVSKCMQGTSRTVTECS